MQYLLKKLYIELFSYFKYILKHLMQIVFINNYNSTNKYTLDAHLLS